MYCIYFDCTHEVTNLPPLSTVRVTPDATVNGPVTCAFSVASMVTSDVKLCAFVLNIPPDLKLPLFSAAGVTVAPPTSRKYTKILLPELEEGAALNVYVCPSGTV